MKPLIACMLVQLASFSLRAQQDSLNFLNANWIDTRISRGIHLRRCLFNHSLFSSNQNISILIVDLNKRNRVDAEADPHQLKPTSSFGSEYEATAALNGTFFDMKNGGSEDYIRINGKLLNATRMGKTGQRSFHSKSALLLNGNQVSIAKWDGSPDWEDSLRGEDVMVTGPLLIESGQPSTLDTISFYTARHPRSAVLLEPGRVIFLAVDGRNQRAAGMTLAELATIARWLHATDAINLDGGGSTTLWVKKFPGGVVNYPSDNKKMEKSPLYRPGVDLDKLAADEQKWDHTGERPVANVITINAKK